MKKTTLPLIILLFTSFLSSAQWPSGVTTVDMNGKDSAVVQGDMAKGSPMQDLSWAWNSANACFPGTQAAKFKGNHVFFAVRMAPKSEMFISVTPTDASADLSIYAYRIGANEYNLVPDLNSCITCEADHKWDRPWKGKVQTSERHVSFQNPGTETYNILIGVSGPASATSGTFNLKIKYQ
ncbi:MAG: hypothetical protein U0U70_01540 [Chitinophagaceae bacterium]